MTVLTRPPQQSVTAQFPDVSTLTTQVFVHLYLTPLKTVSLAALASPAAIEMAAATTSPLAVRYSIVLSLCD